MYKFHEIKVKTLLREIKSNWLVEVLASIWYLIFRLNQKLIFLSRNEYRVHRRNRVTRRYILVQSIHFRAVFGITLGIFVRFLGIYVPFLGIFEAISRISKPVGYPRV